MRLDGNCDVLYPFFFKDACHELVEHHSKSLYSQIKSAVERMRINLITKRSRIESLHGWHPSILDHRSLRFGLHVSLQVVAFGNFIDKMEIDENTIDSKYFACASSLMQQMSDYYPSESDRINAFFLEAREVFPETIQVRKGRATTDRSITVLDRKGQRHYVCNFEMKNEFSSCSADGVKQNHASFMKLQDEEKGKSPMLIDNYDWVPLLPGVWSNLEWRHCMR